MFVRLEQLLTPNKRDLKTKSSTKFYNLINQNTNTEISNKIKIQILT